MYTLFNEIPAQLPDCSTTEFCAFGLFKQAVGKRNSRALNELWKMVRNDWDKIVLRQF